MSSGVRASSYKDMLQRPLMQGLCQLLEAEIQICLHMKRILAKSMQYTSLKLIFLMNECVGESRLDLLGSQMLPETDANYSVWKNPNHRFLD